MQVCPKEVLWDLSFICCILIPKIDDVTVARFADDSDLLAVEHRNQVDHILEIESINVI